MNPRFRDDARLVLTCIAEDLQEISGRVTHLLDDHAFKGDTAVEWVISTDDDWQRLESIAVQANALAIETKAALAQILTTTP